MNSSYCDYMVPDRHTEKMIRICSSWSCSFLGIPTTVFGIVESIWPDIGLLLEQSISVRTGLGTAELSLFSIILFAGSSLVAISILWLWREFLFGVPVKLYFNQDTVHIVVPSGVDSENESSPKQLQSKAKVLYQSLGSLVRQRCPLLASPGENVYYPHPFITNPHFQTAHAAFLTYWTDEKVEFNREMLRMKDGGTIALDWCPELIQLAESHGYHFNKSQGEHVKCMVENTAQPTAPSKTKTPYHPIMLILHGLTGGSHETYVQDLIISLRKHEIPSVVMNFRGCNKTQLTTPHLYSASFTDDLAAVIQHVRSRFPSAILIGAGFSLGGNILVKYAGERKNATGLDGLVSVANPYDLLGGLRGLHRTFLGRNIYSVKMGRNLAELFRRHAHVFEDHEDLDVANILSVKSIREFDELCTRRAFKFRTVDEYYRFGSCAPYIPDISIPSLFLSAEDDPIVAKEIIPVDECTINPHIVLALTKLGGHLGWFRSGWDNILGRERWFADPVAQFVDMLYSSIHEARMQGVSHIHSPIGQEKETKMRKPSLVKQNSVLIQTEPSPRRSELIQNYYQVHILPMVLRILDSRFPRLLSILSALLLLLSRLRK